MRKLAKITTLLADRLVERATASAAPCDPITYHQCRSNGRAYRCRRDPCTGQELGCVMLGYC